jgi:four helix bundle protein
MSDQSEALKQRARAFGVAVLRLIDRLPKTPGAHVVAGQLAKSSTSVGSNYVASCTARSRAEFISKLCTVNEEADESVHWLQVIIDASYLPQSAVEPVLEEAVELRAIFGRSLGTARRNSQL